MEKSLLLLAFGRGISVVFQFIAFGLIGRHLGPDGLGLINASRSIWQIGAGPICGSIDTCVVRSISQANVCVRSVVRDSVLLKTKFAFAYIAIIILAKSYESNNTSLSVVFLTCGVVLGPAISCLGALQACEKFRQISLSISLESIFLVLLTTAVIKLNGGILIISGATSLAVIAGAVVTHGMIKKNTKSEKIQSTSALIKIQHVAWLAIYQLGVSMYSTFDLVIIENICGSNEAGIYSAAQRVLSIGVTAQSMLVQVTLPKLLNANTGVSQNAAKTKRELTHKTLALAVLVSVLYFFFGGTVVETTYGKEFSRATSAIRILSAATFLVFCQSLLVPKILANHQERKMAVVCLAAASISILGNLMVVKIYGLGGASYIRVGIELFVLLALISLSKSQSTISK